MDKTTLEAIFATGAMVGIVALAIMPLVGAWMDGRKERKLCPNLSKDAVRMAVHTGARWVRRIKRSDGRA